MNKYLVSSVQCSGSYIHYYYPEVMEFEKMEMENPSESLFADATKQANQPKNVNSFRRMLPQFLAGIAQMLLNTNIGLALSFPTIVIPAIQHLDKINVNEPLFFTRNEAGFLAGLISISQPFGCFLSGIICDQLGRKRAIIICNFVPLIGWILLANSTNPMSIYFTFALMGFGTGLTSSIIYVSEVCEASVRGILMALAGIVTCTGMFLVLVLGSYLEWRYVAYICAFVPVTNIIMSIFLPETPIWLLSKERYNEALKSLQWLRGWVSAVAVETELNQLKGISEASNACQECGHNQRKCGHPAPRIIERFKLLTQKRTMKALTLISILFFFQNFCSMFQMRAFLIPVLKAHGIALDENTTAMIIGAIGILANFVILVFVKLIGKRKLYLYSMIGNVLTCLGLAAYGFTFFPAGWSSKESNAGIIKEIVGDWNYFALAMFLVMQFFISFGVSAMPFFVMCEIFPLKSRSFYFSILSSENQLFGFLATTSYYATEDLLTLPGVFVFYTILGVIGYFVSYLMFPETENRTMEEIELHYSDDSKSIFDIEIRTNAASNNDPKPNKTKTKN